MERPYYRARRTPDGPMVTRHDPGGLEPLVFPAADYDWGELNTHAVRLALELIVDVTGGLGHAVYPDSLAEHVLAKLPRDGWVLPCDAVREWLDRRYNGGEECPF